MALAGSNVCLGGDGAALIGSGYRDSRPQAKFSIAVDTGFWTLDGGLSPPAPKPARSYSACFFSIAGSSGSPLPKIA